MSDFDATDAKHRLCDEFPPDKASTWSFPMERDGWMVAHNALRGEMETLKQAMQCVKDRGQPLQAWEVTALQKAFDAHCVHVHAHHRHALLSSLPHHVLWVLFEVRNNSLQRLCSNEDDIHVPVLKQRFHYPEKLEAEHSTLVDELQKLESIVQAVKEGDSIDSILSEMVKYEAMMLPHLKEEEVIGLPLMRAYFTQRDLGPMIAKTVSRSPPIETGSLVHFHTPERWRSEFMTDNGIPFFVWYIDFQFKHGKFLNAFWNNVEALKSGIAPVNISSWWQMWRTKK